MPYENYENTDDYIIVDLRSDTISKPTNEMREAMYNAEVGDDVYNEDPTVKYLESRAAELLGKERGLFVPTGTMANLIAIMVHCTRRGSEIIAGDLSHTFLFEQAGCAQIAGVQLATVANKQDGTFCLEELKSKIRINPDAHEPITSLIIVENTHNMCGGKVLPLNWLDELVDVAKEHDIPLHMDGARLFNAAVASNIDAKRIVRDFDSVCFCLSKSLGCPIGSILVGSGEFISMALRMRKALGGGMRQVGVIAAPGLVALDKMISRLEEDHKRTYKIGEAIHNLHSKYFKVDLASLHTNILMIYLDTNKFVAKNVLQRFANVRKDDKHHVSVRAISRNPKFIRITVYHNIDDKDVSMAIDKICLVIREFDAIY